MRTGRSVAAYRKRGGGSADISAPDHAQHGSILAALPIAAAVIARDSAGAASIVECNAAFAAVAAGSRAGPLLPHADLAGRIEGFLDGDGASLELDWSDGDAPGGRHFAIRLGRLDAAGQGDACLISLLDCTAEVETQRSLRAELLHDSLTGLPNRVAFEEAVEQASAADVEGAPRLGVLVVDLARFSRINESMGSVVGDELIITFARRLIGAVRSGDRLARIGGDEFGVLMAVNAGEDDLLEAASRIRHALHAPFRLSGLEIRVECAVGCALAGESGAPDDLIRNAQLALKRAKDSRRIEIYQRGEVTAVHRRFTIETELRRAIENEQLTLAFQPLMDLQRGGVSGFEALARWHHPDRGAISPVEFIPVAEESGLIVPLGRWALDRAIATLAGWDAQVGRVLPLSMAVNMSPWQMARDDMPAQVAGTLAAHGIAGRRLTLEITESAIIGDPARAMRVLRQLAKHDVTVALDDFGTGYSSLAYLQKLPIDLLKIDRSFVTPMLDDRDSVAIVRAILSLAESLGMRTTAEGIETEQLARTLGALGCGYGQGYHFARPLPAAEALAFWRAHGDEAGARQA